MREKQRLQVAAGCGAFRHWAAVFLELEQGGLLHPRTGSQLLAAKLQDIAPEMALAVNLDEAIEAYTAPPLAVVSASRALSMASFT